MKKIPQLPDRWNDWTIEDCIGAGAYGNVYKAFNCTANEYSAIKIIRIPENDSEKYDISFEYPDIEQQKKYYLSVVNDITAKIDLIMGVDDTKNIVKVFDYSVEHDEDELSWCVILRMELLTPFQEYCIYHTFTEEDVRKLALHMCSALRICEQNNLIHRDIKPSNILVDEYGNFKLTDFDVARGRFAESNMSIRGTFSYMAPEVFKHLPYDKKADQYSLGIVLYRLLNNNRDPFVDPNVQIVYIKEKEKALRRRMKGERIPKPLHASDAMYKILKKMLSFDPKKRYKKLSNLELDLMRYGYEEKYLTKIKRESIRKLISRLERLL